ncbi:putative ACT domain-containing protein [Lupinus albus]|uniref:ACT domain-containing protein ACR n=1 Tax=Lupinus albus TaxID=3870 RepID=A0A6A4NNA4_LUPAL|nr:putative ACT domain-containing protein [Lupinus albus]
MQGMELELSARDHVGLLSDITRIFLENSLCIKRAKISTENGKAKDTFYVTNVTGSPVDFKIIDSIRRQIDDTTLQVKHNSSLSQKAIRSTTMGILFIILS